jgi:hypothetical protein
MVVSFIEMVERISEGRPSVCANKLEGYYVFAFPRSYLDSFEWGSILMDIRRRLGYSVAITVRTEVE